MAVSENSGIPKSSILIGFSIKDHPFFGVPLFWKHPYIFTKILGFFCRAYFLVFLRPTLLPVAWGFANRLCDLTNLRDLAREFFGVLETSGRYNQLGYVCIYIYIICIFCTFIYIIYIICIFCTFIYIIYIMYIYIHICVYVYISCRVHSRTSLDVCETVTFCRSYKYRCEVPPSIFAAAGLNIFCGTPHTKMFMFMNGSLWTLTVKCK